MARTFSLPSSAEWISGAEWRALLRHRPGRGWPLSSVTALELVAGIGQVPFKSTKHMLNLAFSLLRGRILEDPRPLIFTEILHVPLHPDFVLFSRTIRRHIDVARHARSVEEYAAEQARAREEQQRASSKLFLVSLGVAQVGSHLRALHSRDEIFDENLARQVEIETLVRATLQQRLTGSESFLDVQRMAREIVDEEVGA